MPDRLGTRPDLNCSGGTPAKNSVPPAENLIMDAKFVDLRPYFAELAGTFVLVFAGMIAARILVEMGEEPKANIRRVRSARLGTIETYNRRNTFSKAHHSAPRLDLRPLGQSGGASAKRAPQ